MGNWKIANELSQLNLVTHKIMFIKQYIFKQ